jgi:hypothetical protein
MAKKRPTAVTVMAILNLVFGGLGMLCYLCFGILIVILMAALKQPGQDPKLIQAKEVIDSMTREVPGLIPFLVFGSVLGVILAIILIVGGIGLLNMQNWARVLCIVYSIVSIVAQLGSLVYRLAVLNPALAQWERNWAALHGGPARVEGGPLGSNALVNNVSEVVGTGISLAYAIILLVIMLLPTTVAAFRGRLPGDQFGEGGRDRWGEYGEEEDRWAR